MDIRFTLQSLAGTLPRRRMRALGRRFLAATADCQATQRRVLSELLQANGSSDFGREHGLDRDDAVDQLESRVPVVDYEYYRPWIDRMKAGDQSAMLGRDNPLLMFTLSSGTTADAKFIPVSRRSLDDYRRGWKTWAIFAYDDHPAAAGFNIIQFVSHPEQFRTEGGTPCGNISGLAIRMQSRFVVKHMYSVPFDTARIAEPQAKYYAAMRFGITDPRVGMVTTANPSTLLHVARLANDHAEDIIRDISDGTISRNFEIGDDIRSDLARRLKPNRKRARDLEDLVTRSGQLLPKDYWPSMQFLAVWTGGSCAAYLDSVKDLFGDAVARDHGLHASEGRMTIPLDDNCCDGVLDIVSNYFEFIPAEEYGQEHASVLKAHELEMEREYYILLTTGAGLYRYDICDVVRCTGFCGTTPLLRFLHKGAHIANVTGEKISESQVVEAVQSSAHALDLDVGQFAAMPLWGDPPAYRLVVEDAPSHLTAAPDQGHQGDQWSKLASQVDTRLQELNIEYREKRQSQRLGQLSLVSIPHGTWMRFASARRQKRGGSLEQYKHPCLIADLETSRDFFRDHVAG